MHFNKSNLDKILSELAVHGAVLVAVSKTKSIESIREVYEAGHKIFGENYVQELVDKQKALPDDIEWHFIGHLQSNKVKLIAPFIALIHGIDSFRLLKEVNKQAQINNRVIDCLLQIHIAKEETKFGLSIPEAEQLLAHPEFHALKNICVRGLMGMATLTSDGKQIRQEFRKLAEYFNTLRSRVYKPKKVNGKIPERLTELADELSFPSDSVSLEEHAPSAEHNLRPDILSMGMSSDYRLALAEGSTLVRIGSLIFGER